MLAPAAAPMMAPAMATVLWLWERIVRANIKWHHSSAQARACEAQPSLPSAAGQRFVCEQEERSYSCHVAMQSHPAFVPLHLLRAEAILELSGN